MLDQPPLHKTPGWPHQVQAYHYAMGLRGVMLPLKMGRGKTWIAINVIANTGAKRVLILSPPRVLGVWRGQFALHSPIRPNLVILDKKSDTSRDKVRRAEQALLMSATRGETCVIIVNYETAIRPEFNKFLLSKLWDVIICDEIHRAKAANGAAGKLIGQLGHIGKKKLGLSGTPLPHDLLDAFAQYRFLDPRIYGYDFVKFRQTYAKMHEMFKSKVVEWTNEADFYEKFWSIAYRDDGLGGPELPAFTDQTITCELSPKAREIYDEMENQLIAEVESGIVTAANALVKIVRLQQITAGFVKTEEGIEQQIDDSKENALAALVEDAGRDEPIVVFCKFRRSLDAVARVAKQLDLRYGEISGRRSDLTEHAKLPDDVDLAGVQIQAGGVGVDLTRARYGFYFDQDYNWGDREQSRARLHRPGQTRTVHYYKLVAARTIDWAILRALAQREDLINSVMARPPTDQELVEAMVANLKIRDQDEFS